MLDDYQEEQGCCGLIGLACIAGIALIGVSCCLIAALGFIRGFTGN